MTRINEIHLPPSSGTISVPNPINVENGSLVITGANGSGKTRLGSWIELNSPLHDRVHRIAAQKSLTVPRSARTFSLNDALDSLKYGVNVDHIQNMKNTGRYSDAQLKNHKKQLRLFDSLEAERSDCLFVYITHDLEFAASRIGLGLS